MKREIKFRGKVDIGGGIWEYGALTWSRDKSRFYISKYNAFNPDTPYFTKILPETIGQFIGLMDKNGKDIYEGDLVVYCEQDIFKIIYSDQKACFSLAGTYIFADIIAKLHDSALTTLHQDRFEVVGNIHDDLDLLKQAGLVSATS